MGSMKKWEVAQKHAGLSLQSFLKEQLGFSGKQIKRMIDSGYCSLNGRPERFASRLIGHKDVIELKDLPKVPKSEIPNNEIESRILYTDEDLIAYNKPAGITSDNKTLLDSLSKQFGEVILLHRLDKDTTGVLLFARSKAVAGVIESQFRKRSVKKTYLAIVQGVPSQSSGIIDNFLGKLHVFHGQTVWGEVSKEKGLHARTSWKVQKKGNKTALLECHPETGRTHQIRVHLSGIGYPILGDHQYGASLSASYRPERILLHAAEIVLNHPKTNQSLLIKSPAPPDFIQTAEQLWGKHG